MPAPAPSKSAAAAARLQALGGQLRARRKALRISAVSAAEAAGLSRTTLHRIELGEPSVTIGAWLNVIDALGLDLVVTQPGASVGPAGTPKDWIPARVHVSRYPQLQRLAWQVHGADELTAAEALDVYERNWRHVDVETMEPAERELVEALRIALSRKDGDV